jgi:hypothetical protein
MRDMHESYVYGRAVRIIMRVEKQLRIAIPDNAVDGALPWQELTLSHLSAAVCRAIPSLSAPDSDAIIRSALTVEFPTFPGTETLDFGVPLFEAFSLPRN